jgi:hypothetical protein
MTVDELIEKLEEFDGDYEVKIHDRYHDFMFYADRVDYNEIDETVIITA